MNVLSAIQRYVPPTGTHAFFHDRAVRLSHFSTPAYEAVHYSILVETGKGAPPFGRRANF